ncbi:fused uroporphyrinogen-III synthase HemD/membrane protein HemX [Trinickia dabaoshanensis]|uniref:Fused uroporphyrinogen-III synthase HemD/membrane protein HemX n=1 Tax=Trinickia dabaoshanensis TaxID=564714 RepID=A0A2N7VCF5_9BURK|nr:fused uroporphyrinogen-III synthase HemD/membrane protein HemX [Trinickia dabaoshanensis]PMS14861.1 fused uroporphyrinogen-III synthase HemD/membrane protein HemX [Trinickia dabaoshanensis]
MASVEPGHPFSDERAGGARFTAVLTRPAGQTAALAAALERQGIDVLDFPLIEIAAAQDDAPLRAALASIERYALVVFVSPNAIERALDAAPDLVWPPAVPIGVVGPGSIAQLARFGIAAPAHRVIAPAGADSADAENNGDADARFDSEALFAALSARLGLEALTGRPVLIVRGDGGREWLADRLREAGAQVEAVCAYRRVVPAPSADAWARVRVLLGGAPHAWLLTSSEGVRNLDALARGSLTPAEHAALLRAPLVAPHPRIAETARSAGFDTITASGPGDARILAALRALSASSRAALDPPVWAPTAQASSSTHSRMTDTNQESSSASSQPAATPPFVPPMPPVYDAPRRRGGGFVWLVLLLLAVATGIAAFALNRKLDRLDTALAARQQALIAQTAELRMKTEQAIATAHQADAQLQQLEGKLADAQTAQQALQQQYQNLAANRDDWTLAEVEQILASASQQLQLTGNTQLALFALQSADTRLAASSSPQALVVRRAIAQDIDKLKAAPSTDLTGLAIKLDDAIAQADTLPLLGEVQSERSAKSAASAAVATSATAPGESRAAHWWRVFSSAAGDELRSLVQVRRLDNADAMLNSPEQGEFIRDNVKLRLLSARLGLLSRNSATLESDLKAADAALARYFDGTSKRTQTVRALIKDVSQGAQTVAVPNLNTSLQAIHDYKSRG